MIYPHGYPISWDGRNRLVQVTLVTFNLMTRMGTQKKINLGLRTQSADYWQKYSGKSRPVDRYEHLGLKWTYLQKIRYTTIETYRQLDRVDWYSIYQFSSDWIYRFYTPKRYVEFSVNMHMLLKCISVFIEAYMSGAERDRNSRDASDYKLAVWFPREMKMHRNYDGFSAILQRKV